LSCLPIPALGFLLDNTTKNKTITLGGGGGGGKNKKKKKKKKKKNGGKEEKGGGKIISQKINTISQVLYNLLFKTKMASR